MPNFAYAGNRLFLEGIADRLTDAGFNQVESIEDAEFFLTYCNNMTKLEDIYFAEHGLIEKAHEGTVFIDLSPSTPNFSNELNAMITLSEMKYVAAPLIVKNQVEKDAFKKSNIRCLAAAEDDSLSFALPILEAVFDDIEELDNIGVVQIARAGNTLQKIAETISAIESYVLLESSKKSVASIQAKGYSINATSPEAYFILNAIEDKQFESTYTVEMLMGELSAVIMAADDYETILPQAEAAFHLLELLAIIGGAEKSIAALYLVYGDQNEQRCKEFGLDWSRAEELYDKEEEAFGLDDLDESFQNSSFDDLSDFDYSSN